jgi:hypothetical protein
MSVEEYQRCKSLDLPLGVQINKTSSDELLVKHGTETAAPIKPFDHSKCPRPNEDLHGIGCEACPDYGTCTYDT